MHMGLFCLRFFLICAASLLLAWLRPAIAGAQPTSIFVLHSYSADYPWSKGQQQGFVQALGADLHSPGGEGLAAFDLRIAYLDTKHTPYTPEYARQTANYFKLRYAGYQPAAVYVTDDNALNFVQAHIDDIFPGVPVFFSGVNDLGVKKQLDPQRFTGVFEQKEIAPNLDLVAKMAGDHENIVLLGDASETYRVIEQDLRRHLQSRSRLHPRFIASTYLDDLLKELQQADSRFVFLTTLGALKDASGRTLTLAETLAAIRSAGNFFIISMEDGYMSPGVIGGWVTSSVQQGRLAGQLLQRYLGGEKLRNLPALDSGSNEYLFDESELQRAGLILPATIRAQARVINVPPGFYEANRNWVLGSLYGLVILVLTLLALALKVSLQRNREVAAANQRLHASEVELRQLAGELDRHQQHLEAIVVERTGMLEKRTQELALAQRMARLGNWWRDVSSGSCHWSDEVYRIYGRDPASCAADCSLFSVAIHPDDRIQVRQREQQALAERRSWASDHRIELASGELRWVHAETRPDYDAAGHLRYLTGTIQDITSRKQAEESLRLYANVVEKSGEAIIITDGECRIVATNAAFTAHSGYVLAEVEGANPKIFASGRTPPETYREMWTALAESDFWQGELWNRRKDGVVYPEWAAISVIRDEQRKITNYIASFTDISERKAAEEHISRLAHHDALTGLFNRFSLQERLEQALLSAARECHQVVLMFLDMDRFKLINDSLGHHVGDGLLIEVANRLRACVRESDIVARLGGDEFVVVLTRVESGMVTGAQIAGKILQRLAEPYQIEANVLHSSPSIGISVYPTDGGSVEALMKNADTAMYHVKEQGRNNAQFFTGAMNDAILERMRLEGDLRQALAEQQLLLYYQPKVAAGSPR